jgi:hypothetical protein
MADSPAVLRFTAGLAGDIYEQSLEGIRSVLLMVGERHWLAWMEEDLRLYRDEGSTEHHRGAYGGMGSFNDLVLSAPGGENQSSAVWLDAALDQLRHLARSSAQAAVMRERLHQQLGPRGRSGQRLEHRRGTPARRVPPRCTGRERRSWRAGIGRAPEVRRSRRAEGR